MKRVTKISRYKEPNGDTVFSICIEGDDGFLAGYDRIYADDFWHWMVDLNILHPDLEPFNSEDVVYDQGLTKLFGDFRTQFGGFLHTQIDYDEVRAGLRNGDTGEIEWCVGQSIVQALARLMALKGYKPAIDPPYSQPHDWIQQFDYGFNRASDEQLFAELESVTTPSKGAW